MRAALFITCLGDTLFPDVGMATVRILERLGVEVEFPVEQTYQRSGLKAGHLQHRPDGRPGVQCSIMAIDDIYIPTFAQSPVTIRGTATGGCAGATIAITKITRQSSNAQPDNMGNPRLDEWGNVKDTIHIEFTISGGTSAQGTVPFTVSWQ